MSYRVEPPPNPRLQRTRAALRPQPVSGKASSPGGDRRAPLSRQPLGASRYPLERQAWTRLASLVAFVLVSVPTLATADPAVGLLTFIPCVGVCPGAVRIIGLTSGEVFPIFVAALDATGNRDPEYTGTIVFSSSDPLAMLPQSYTFTLADQGSHIFMNSGVFRTPGAQTFSAADTSGSLPPAIWAVTVYLPSDAAAIPTTTRGGAILAAVLLAAIGIWVLHVRSSGSGA
jgi:hypothetical protein